MARRPVDEKIVKLSMDNSDLTNKATESTSILSKLTASLNKLPGVNLGKTTQELNNIGDATKNVPMDALGQSVGMLGDRFSAMGIIGMTVLQNLTNRAVDMGIKLAKSLTIDQVTEGFREYELKMGSIRTIMANTEHEGATLGDVKKSLEDLNKYADLTIYNFGQMTDSIGRFTAAGVGLEDSTIAIKGMSNLAATSGATTHQLNSAMYQMSQAMAAGKFNLMDWNSLVNAGMGGKITQDGLKKTAKEMGVAIDMSEGFRESLKDGWLTSEIFLKTMANFAEDESMIEAATKIRTFTQLIDTVQEAIGSGLGMTFEHIFGDFEEATELFSTVGEAMTGWIDKTMDKFNLFVGAIADGGGFLNVFKGFGNILKPVGQILGAVAEGFRRAFKSVTPEVIVNATEKFLKFTESLKLSEGVVKVITSVFEYFFTGIRIGFTAIKNVADIVLPPLIEIGKAIGNIVPSSRGVVDAISGVGIAIGRWLGESKIQPLVNLGTTIEDMFFMFKERFNETGSLLGSFKGLVSDVLSIVISDFKKLEGPLEWFGDILISIGGLAKDFGKAVAPVLGEAWELVKGIFAELEFKDILGGGFLVGVFGITKKIIENMDGLSGIWKGITDFIDVMKNKSDDSAGFLTNISESLTGFSDSLKEGVTIGRIVAIAVSIGILAVSMSQLSKLDSGQIGAAMLAIASAMATLSVGIKALDGVKIDGIGSVQVVAFALAISILTKAMNNVSDLDAGGITKGVVALVSSMGVLVAAVKLMGDVKVGTGPVTLLAIAGTIKILVDTLDDIDAVRVEGLIKGLGTIGILLAEIAIFARTMNYVQIPVSTAISVATIAATMHILVSAIRKIDDIRVEGLIKGLGTIGILLVSIGAFAKLTKGTGLGPAQALGVLGISAAMLIMAKAIRDIDDIRVEGLIKGLGTIGILLGTIAVFAKVTKPAKLAGSAAGLTLMAVAIRLMVPPIKNLGNTRWKELVKGLGALAGALAIMTVAATAATAGIGGAVALVVMSVALNAIIKPIKELGKIKWTTLLSSLGKLAVTIGVIAGASLLLSPAVLPMLAFSGAIAAFGAGVALIGGGLALFGAGLTALAGLTATSIAAIIASIEMLLDGAIGLMEKVGELALAIVITMAETISGSAEEVAQAIVDVILAGLTAIDNRLDDFITRGASIVSSILKGIREEIPDFIVELTITIATVINAVAMAIDEYHEPIVDAVIRVIGAVLKTVIYALQEILIILFGWFPGFETLITNIGGDATDAIDDAFKLNEVVVEEFDVVKARAERLGEEFGYSLKETSEDAVRQFDRYLNLDEATREAFEEMYPEIVDAQGTFSAEAFKMAFQGSEFFKRVSWKPAANHAVDGLETQFKQRGKTGGSLWETVKHLGKGVLKTLNRALGNASPSRFTKESGNNLVEGLIIGLDNMTGKAVSKATSLGSQVVDATNSMLDASVSEMDTEIRIKVVMDTTDLDNFNPDSFKVHHPDTRFTNHMVESSQPRNIQNEDRMYREPKESNEYNYDVHIHATGSLPRTTIRSMAEQFKEEIELIDRRSRINRGEEVVY